MTTENGLYTIKTRTRGGRGGTSLGSHDRFDTRPSAPSATGSCTHSEQLFATDWSASFAGAMGVAAKIRKITLSDGQAIDAEVDLCLTDGEYFLHARLNVSLPRWEREVSTNLGNVALQTYPRSKSPRGYVDIVIDAT